MSHTSSPPRHAALDDASGAERDSAEEASAWVTRALADQAMPPDEIVAILSTADRRLIHRYLELHVERLEESLSAQRRTVEEIEALLPVDPDGLPRNHAGA